MRLLLISIIYLINYSMIVDLNVANWQIVNDTVMGGRSTARITNNSADNLIFSGNVSLENNGGFSMVKSILKPTVKASATHCKLTVKGDGKTYQLRLKPSRLNRESYVVNFKTSSEIETFEFKIEDFKPYFRGRSLDLPAIKNQSIEEVALLIGNKKAEEFELEIIEIEFM